MLTKWRTKAPEGCQGQLSEMLGLARPLEMSFGKAEEAAGSSGPCFCPLPLLSSSFEPVSVDPASALWSPWWILPKQLCLRGHCCSSSLNRQWWNLTCLEQIPQYGPKAGTMDRRQMSSAVGLDNLQGKWRRPFSPSSPQHLECEEGPKDWPETPREAPREMSQLTSHLLPHALLRAGFVGTDHLSCA